MREEDCDIMSYRLSKIFSQLPFKGRNNNIYDQVERAWMHKLPFCSLRVAQTEEGLNDYEFDEDYIYDYPTYLVNECTPSETHFSICEIMQEMEIYSRFYFNPIPSRLKPADWAKLLSLKNASSCIREKEYQSLSLREKHRELKRKQTESWKAERRKDKCETAPFSTNDVIPYELHRNSIFGRRNLLKFMKLGEELMMMKKSLFGPHIIIDCSYESHMIDKELTSCARQLAMLRRENKHAFHPFNIIHCNVQIHGLLFQKLLALIPDLLDPAYVIHYTEKHFLDLFPRDKLIYLSPHATTQLEKYDHDAVYVIGALVDHHPKDNLSTQKAELDGIQSMKFPLEKYSNWCQGTKSLMLNQVVNILYDLKEGHSWEHILSKNIQPFKTTFSEIYWKNKRNATEALSVNHLKHSLLQKYVAESNKRL